MKSLDLEEWVKRGAAAQKAIDAELAAAGRDRFVAVGPKVMRDNKLIAGAVSNNFARRIANALNLYKPDRRGH